MSTPPPPDTSPTWVCQNPKCGVRFPESQLKRTKYQGGEFYRCPYCSDLAEAATRADMFEKPRESRPFWGPLFLSFFFPLKLPAVFVLIVGTVALSFIQWSARALGLFGLIGSAFALFVSGYFIGYLFKIAESGANGKQTPPDLPTYYGFWSSIIKPLVMFWFVQVICFFPVGYLLTVGRGQYLPMDSVEERMWILVFLAVGHIYSNMAMLGMAVNDSLGGMNPIGVIISIVRVFVPYLAVLLLMGMASVYVIVAQAVIEYFASGAVAIVLLTFIWFYSQMVVMRAMGVLYYAHESKFRLL